MIARPAVAPLLLAVAIALAYANALTADFQFDDYNVIVNNPAVHSWAGWAGSMPGIRPLLKLSYTLNSTVALGRVGFHLVNLLCHLASTLLAAGLARRLAATSSALAPVADRVALTAGLEAVIRKALTLAAPGAKAS